MTARTTMHDEPPATSADPPLPLVRRRPRALYVHLPFCARQCPYCDFATTRLRRDVERRYLDALAEELQARLPDPGRLRAGTVFLGGGTPSELTTAGVERLVEVLGPYARGAREVTVEANPRTLLPRKLSVLREGLGVGRVSLGAQSFSPRLLEALGRFHRPRDVEAAVATAREAGVEDVSLDLIFAVPGQTAAELRSDLRRALALGPEHVSVYGLTFEPGTAFEERRRRGRLRPVPERRQARYYALVRRLLREGGLEHYEVSSFARPGRRCLHNRIYWRNHPYVGVGNGAASHVHGERTTNLRDVAAYVDAAGRGRSPVAERERLGPAAKVRETAYLALRTSEGVRRDRFLRDTGVDPHVRFAAAWEKLAGLGLVRVTEERVHLTGRGVSVADAVALEVL